MAPDMELVASQAASALASFVGMSSDRADEVRMAVVEACINAFEHSRADERKVDITFRVWGGAEPERLEIQVHDAGVGFAPLEVEEPRIEDKLRGTRKRGWGLKIIQGLMDEVRISSGSRGTTVIMSKLR
jgi:serine/threonine-protein kinase RsbW